MIALPASAVRQWLTASRRVRTYLLRATYLLALTAVAVTVYYQAVPAGTKLSVEQLRLASAGSWVIAGVLGFQFLAAQVWVAVYVTLSLRDELRGGTYPLMCATPMTGVSLLGGPVLAGLFQVAVLIALSLPLLVLVRALGGVSAGAILAAEATTFAAAVLTATLTALACCWLPPRGGALVLLRPIGLAGGAAFVLTVLATVLAAGGSLFGAGRLGASAATLICPYASMLLQWRAMGDPSFPGAYGGVVALNLAGTLAAGAVLLGRAGRYARGPLLGRALGPDAPDEPPSLGRRRLPDGRIAPPPPIGRLGPRGRSAGRPRPTPWVGGAFAVGWKEADPRLFPPELPLRIAGIGWASFAIVAGLAATSARFQDSPPPVGSTYLPLLAAAGLLLACLAAAVLAASAISGERRAHTWDALRGAPVRDTHLLAAKLLGPWRRGVWILAGPLAPVITAVLLGLASPLAWLAANALTAGALLFAGSLAAGLAMRLRGRGAANAAVAGMLICGWWLLPALGRTWVGPAGDPATRLAVNWLVKLSPPHALADCLTAGIGFRRGGPALAPAGWALASAAVWGALGWALFGRATRQLRAE